MMEDLVLPRFDLDYLSVYILDLSSALGDGIISVHVPTCSSAQERTFLFCGTKCTTKVLTSVQCLIHSFPIALIHCGSAAANPS